MRLHSFDEWSPLREVVLGSAAGYRSQTRDLSFELFYFDNLVQDNPRSHRGYYPTLADNRNAAERVQSPPNIRVKQRYVEELNEDVENMAATFESLGVDVLRPMRSSDSCDTFSTLAWSATALPPLNVRDNTLIAGTEIVETPPMMRSRYFETQLLKPLFQRYFEEGARWTVMPRPWMTDASFDLTRATEVGGMELVSSVSASPYDVGIEMLFDAAQCLRFGKDIIVNVANQNHMLGYRWLERHFEGVFRLHLLDRLTDSHIDSALMPLRPGLMLIRTKNFLKYLPPSLQKWTCIEAPVPHSRNFPQYDNDDVILTSPYIDLNVLSIDEDTVMVNDASPELMRQLESYGFTVVPVRHRHRRLFGGGLHCFTLDTVRDGQPEDYLS